MSGYPRTFSLTWHLTALVLASMIPLLVFSVLMVNWLAGGERAKEELRLARATRTLALVTDQEIEGTIRTVQTLAESTALRRGDLRTFHAMLKRVLRTQPYWITVLVHTPDGTPVLNATRKLGAPLSPAVENESLKLVFRSGQPTIGAIARGQPQKPRLGRFAFPIRVPVRKDNKIIYSLSAVISSEALQRLADRSSTEALEEWTKVLVDTRGIVAARSRAPEAYVGRAVPAPYLKAFAENSEGILRGTSLEGEPIYLSYFRLPFSSWVAAIAVPVGVLEVKANQAQVIVILTSVSLLIVFGGIAVLYSRHLTRSFRRVTNGAAALVRGEAPQIPKAGVREIDKLRDSIVSATNLLRQRERERNENLAQAQVARAEAEKASQAKSEFLANMSHELRTPLGVILGMLDLLSSPEISADEKAGLMARTKRNAEYLATLINQTLDLAKAEANALEIETKPFVLPDMLENLAEDFRVQTEAKGISLEFETCGSLPGVLISDPFKLRQVLINVIGNAIKFTTRGQIHVLVRTPEQQDSESLYQIEFIVTDSGIGMTSEQQSRLFRPFSQADGSMTRRFGGTGLGLAFSKRVAQALGGDIELVRSEPEKGSVFRIWIRAKTSHQIRPEKLLTAQADVTPKRPLEALKILLVEDSVDNRFILSQFLTHAGAEITEAENGQAGVEAASAHHFDCVLMDIQMPVMDGNQAMVRLRQQGFRRPIIALTAHALHSDRERGLRVGYSAYLSKPVNRTELIEVIAMKVKESLLF
ncbi:MAG: response regulator [Bdellovibrionales bacterium]